ncbi:MAG: MmgE/PrpD family protein [Gammaproteobacteria bacterium]|jgi:2-methylcitrate dehydratase PrpD|nr:MmgE/PrpD family protein [Gammaproteobacteria bacterium]
MSLTKKLAEFVTTLDVSSIPAEVVEKARACILNGYGIALGSHQTPFYSVAGRAALMMDGERSTGPELLGDGRRTTVAGAAFANAALFHGRAQEDTCGVAHFGAILLPLLTAMLENGEGEITDYLPALVAGYEVGGLLEAAYSAKTTPAGLRASPLYGTIAAAAAVSRMWRLDAGRTAAALANAASFAGGILQSFGDGTDEWRYQVGIACRNGLAAASLAAQGSVSADNAFEGRSGFVRAFVRSDCDVEALAARLGKVWAISSVTFKPYPVCALNQTPVTVALALRECAEFRPEAVKSARVVLNPVVVGYAGMDSCGPFESISGTLMSVQFCVATTILYGTPTVASMKRFDDSGVNALMPRIELVADEGMGLLACRIELALEGQSEPLVQELRADTRNYSYDRPTVAALVRRIGNETGVPERAYDLIERFAEQLPNAALADVLSAFNEIRSPGRGAGAHH